MNIAHLLEATMLVCFGFSWPLNVIKAYKSRTAKGTSLAFIILIISGYIAGILAKFLNGQINYVLAVYFLNLLIVSANIAVYIRNKSLDRKRAFRTLKAETESEIAESVSVHLENIENQNIENIAEFGNSKNLEDAGYVKDIGEIGRIGTGVAVKRMEIRREKEDDMSMNYSNSLDEFINPERISKTEAKNSVILIGTSLDRKIPVAELAKKFDFNFNIYNKSRDSLKLAESANYFEKEIAPLEPEGILLHLGENDAAVFGANSKTFDALYLNLIEEIKKTDKKIRIAVVSASNLNNDKTANEMNRHIKAIAESENCTFVDLSNVRLWNPEATKSSLDFAYANGLRTRKPLRNVAEILYSYAFANIPETARTEHLVG